MVTCLPEPAGGPGILSIDAFGFSSWFAGPLGIWGYDLVVPAVSARSISFRFASDALRRPPFRSLICTQDSKNTAGGCFCWRAAVELLICAACFSPSLACGEAT